jgi:acetylornithine deacetylase/succinyl-diaminopimelate desuccinylase
MTDKMENRIGAMDTNSALDVLTIAGDLIQIPSYSHTERQEEKVADYIFDFFKSAQIEVKRQWVSEGRPNVIARIPGNGGRGLMLTGHMDTVPPYDMKNPFSGEIRGDNLHGRGACDMKGSLAAMMAAMVTIRNSGITPAGDVYFAAVVDEEEKGTGVEALIRNWPDVDAVIVGEPTKLNIGLGHKGLEWIRVQVAGRKTHSGNLKSGVNAISMAGHLIHYLDSEYNQVLEKRVHPILGAGSINIGTISGGDQPSTVADSCEFVLDRRFLPMETLEQVYGEIQEAIDRMKEVYPGFEATVSNYYDDKEMLPHLPYAMDDKGNLVRCIIGAMEDLDFGQPVFEPFAAWSDGGMIRSQTGSQCIIMGPGDLGLAHSADESIPVLELKKAVELYASIGLAYGQGGQQL